MSTETTGTTDTTSTTSTTSTTDTTSTTSTTSTTGMTLFTLPREDWYDEDGRLYKDAIIENLNAIEDKLNELAAINAFDADTPDVSNLHLEDVTLESDDDKIVNLRSLINILGLVNYPMELEFSGIKIKKISYYNSSYAYITRTNISTSLTDENKFLFYDFSDNSVRVSSSVSVGENESLIGCYLDGRVMNMFSPFFARLNFMYLLTHMGTDTMAYHVAHGTGDFIFPSKQQAAYGSAESKGGSSNNTALEWGK